MAFSDGETAPLTVIGNAMPRVNAPAIKTASKVARGLDLAPPRQSGDDRERKNTASIAI
jgi:hypothetical protein